MQFLQLSPGKPWTRSVTSLLLYLVGFLVFFHLGRNFGPDGVGSLWYPPAGLRFFALLLGGFRWTVALMIFEPAALFIYTEFFQPTPYNQIRFVLQAAQVPAAYGVLILGFQSLTSFDRRLQRVRDVVWLIAASLLIPLPVMLALRTFAVQAGIAEVERWLPSVLSFWIGDVIGILMLTPILLVLHRQFFDRANTQQDPLATSLLAEPLSVKLLYDFSIVWIFLLVLHFLPNEISERTRHIHWYLVFPPLLWITYLRGFLGSIVAGLALTSGMSWMITLQADSSRFLELQVLIILLASSTLLTGAVVSDHRSTQRRLREQNDALREVQRHLHANSLVIERRNKQLQRFFYSVSHDLKSPLFTIQGYLGHLEDDVRQGRRERLEQDLARIRTAASTLGDLLDGILKTAKAGTEDSREEIDLGTLVRRVVSHLERPLAERGVLVEIRAHLPIVYGDPTRLIQVFQNLMENSIKFMGDQEEPTIVVGCVPDPDEPTIFISDNGIGIREEYQEKVFRLFEQLDLSSGGTGLGLALVRQIVEEHGGRIWAESEGEGHGTTFFLTLQKVSTDQEHA